MKKRDLIDDLFGPDKRMTSADWKGDTKRGARYLAGRQVKLRKNVTPATRKKQLRNQWEPGDTPDTL